MGGLPYPWVDYHTHGSSFSATDTRLGYKAQRIILSVKVKMNLKQGKKQIK